MTDLIPFTHADLCAVAVKWLKRPASAGGHGCHVAASECRSGWSGEIPDAIGFRAAGDRDGSVVVEVKVSRSDFLADRNKPHRLEGGMGNWRYFMAPAGMIRPDELPPGWGLIEVTPRGQCKVLAGAVAGSKVAGYDTLRQQVNAWRQPGNAEREQWLLVKLLSRVGDADELNQKLRNAYSEQRRLMEWGNKLQAELRQMARDLWNAKRANNDEVAA